MTALVFEVAHIRTSFKRGPVNLGLGPFKPSVTGGFSPWSFQPWVDSAKFGQFRIGGSFRPDFSQLSCLLQKVN